MNPISASNYSIKSQIKPSFGRITSVSYVIVDGQTVLDRKIIDDVTRNFVTQIRKCLPKDKNIRQEMYKITNEKEMLSDTFQPIKKMGNYLITGQDAIDLGNIWSLSKVSRQEKAEKASGFVRYLLSRVNPKRIALVAEKTIVKGKEKYLVKDIYKTSY